MLLLLWVFFVKQTSDGEEFILEVNDTAIGLGPSHHNADSVRIARLALRRAAEFAVSSLVDSSDDESE
jgi:hypothetical protein